MKKILFMIACCLMATVQKATAQNYGKAFYSMLAKSLVLSIITK